MAKNKENDEAQQVEEFLDEVFKQEDEVQMPHELEEQLKQEQEDEAKKLCELAERLRLEDKAKKLNRLLARLKVEKARDEYEYDVIGREHGKEDAYMMKYEHLRKLEDIHVKLVEKGWKEEQTAKMVTESPVWSAWFADKVKGRKIPEQSAVSYLSGWLRGVLSVWDQVKDRIE